MYDFSYEKQYRQKAVYLLEMSYILVERNETRDKQEVEREGKMNGYDGRYEDASRGAAVPAVSEDKATECFPRFARKEERTEEDLPGV